VRGANEVDDSSGKPVSEFAIAPSEQGHVLLPAVRAGDVLTLNIKQRPNEQVRPPSIVLMVDRDVADDEADRQLDRAKTNKRILAELPPVAESYAGIIICHADI
jgi:hypothetical protein